MTQQTLARLRELKLSGMAAGLEQQLTQISTYEGLSFIERLGLLAEQEHLMREQRKRNAWLGVIAALLALLVIMGN